MYGCRSDFGLRDVVAHNAVGMLGGAAVADCPRLIDRTFGVQGRLDGRQRSTAAKPRTCDILWIGLNHVIAVVLDCSEYRMTHQHA